MKWLEISEEIFLKNRGRAEITQKDGDCFGMDIDGKFYLYVYNGCDYFLNIYSRQLREIFSDDMFFECMAKFILDKECHITDLLHWFVSGRPQNRLPFFLDDIHYCEYDG